MKVAEEATARTAYVHIYIEGKLEPVGEYGEYVDPTDNAVCCYVPLEEDQTIRIGGKFSGTTLAIAYDTLVDGVCRKTTSSAAKTVHCQKNKKLDTMYFLYRTESGTVDAKISVKPLKDFTVLQGEETETVGTMELRLYITRQLGVTHKVENMETYYLANAQLEHSTEQSALYNQIAPTLQMMFEDDTVALDAQKAAREQRKMDSARPGNEPWAIFHFHYRSSDAIAKHGLQMTFDPSKRKESECHTLVLDPVSPLVPGTRTHKDDGDTLTQGSSPVPSEVPLTPIRSSHKGSTVEPPLPPSKPRSRTKPASGVDTGTLPDQTLSRDIEKEDDADSVIPMIAADDDEVKGHQTPETPGSNTTWSELEKAPTKFTDILGRSQSVDSDTIVVTMPKPKTNDALCKPKKSSLSTFNSPMGCVSNMNETAVHNIVKPTVQSFTTSTNKPAIKSKLAAADTTITQIAPYAPPTTVVPTKRPAPITTGAPFELKRTKLRTAHSLVTTPEAAGSSPSPKPLSIERQVAEQRRKLESLRKKRTEMAEKQSKIDRQMEPYKKRVAEELERLNADMEEEELAFTEEYEHLAASLEILRKFKQADCGN